MFAYGTLGFGVISRLRAKVKLKINKKPEMPQISLAAGFCYRNSRCGCKKRSVVKLDANHVQVNYMPPASLGMSSCVNHSWLCFDLQFLILGLPRP